MFWYLLNISMIIIVWLAKVDTPIKLLNEVKPYSYYHRIRTKRVCIAGTIGWVILAGFRAYSIGPDTYQYKINHFDAVARMSWNRIFTDFKAKYFLGEKGNKDLGYRILEKIFQIFSKNYTTWLIFIAALFMIPLAVLVYKYSKNACVSYIVYSTLFYSFFSVTGHRQTIATALVVLIGIEFIKEQKLIPFLITVVVGYTIHASCICFLPFYWISRIKLNKATLTIYWIAIFFSFVFRRQLLSFLQLLVGYEDFQELEGARLATFAILLLSMTLIGTIFWKRIKNSSDNPLLNISMNALLMACFFSSLLTINQAFMRVVQYYSLFIIFILPEYTCLFDERSKKIFNVIICGVMIFLLIMTHPVYYFIGFD